MNNQYVERKLLRDREAIAKLYGYTVLIPKTDIDDIVPTFHALKYTTETQCGITLKKQLMLVLPAVHAIAFGQPCKECWPGDRRG